MRLISAESGVQIPASPPFRRDKASLINQRGLFIYFYWIHMHQAYESNKNKIELR
jgi:hypothetical protein